MFTGRKAALATLVLVSLLIAVPLLSDNADAAYASGDVTVSFSPGSVGDLTLRAGEIKEINITLSNTSSEARHVEFMGVDFGGGPLSYSTPEGQSNIFELEPDGEFGASTTFTLTIKTDRYSGSAHNNITTFTFVAYDPSVVFVPGDITTGEEIVLVKTVHISSRLASENQYNRIMGIWNNPLPEPFDTALYATAITFAIWLGIAILCSFVIIPKLLLPIVFRRKDKENRKAFYKKIQKYLFIILMLYGITMCLPVFGAGEYMISMVSMVAQVVYILLGVLIAIKFLAAILDVWEKHAKEEDEDEYDVRDSLAPLFMMIGKIIIGMAATAMVLGALGFDLMIIATGAGIIGIAISFGAQSTLAQFFGGITLLVNRPFRPGDLVRLDSSTETLRVLNVGFMMTTFRNWANSEIYAMPNQKVVSSTIINITAESLAFRIIVLTRVPYGTDVVLAKKLALAAMTEHPRILQDGSEEIPKVRLEEFSESSLTIRVSGFVDDFEDHRSIAGEIREAIYKKYRENGITIAIPKMEVFLKDPKDLEHKL